MFTEKEKKEGGEKKFTGYTLRRRKAMAIYGYSRQAIGYDPYTIVRLCFHSTKE